jgi:hypothetical protein
MHVTEKTCIERDCIMSSKSKREYLEAIYLRYKRAFRKDKAIILDEFCTTCGYHRKHAIRLLKKFTRFIKPKKKKRGRTPLYSKEVIVKPLKKIGCQRTPAKETESGVTVMAAGYVQEYGHLPAESQLYPHLLLLLTGSETVGEIYMAGSPKPGHFRNRYRLRRTRMNPIQVSRKLIRCSLWYSILGIASTHRLRRYCDRLDRTEGGMG